ncbi:hypothetical protein ACFRCX_30760 [Streptomyces sp. NPDC056652]
MTWPEGSAAVLGVVAAAMVAISQHGLHARTTTPHEPPDGEHPKS